MNDARFFQTRLKSMYEAPLLSGRERTGRSGFTLLELIISMTILSIVALIIGSGFRLGLRAWEQGDKEIMETQKLRALSALISQNLKSIYPYKMEIENKNVVLFEGDKNSVLFAAVSSDPYRRGFMWMKYSYSEGKFELNEGILPDKEVLENVSEGAEILDEDSREITFEYLSPEDDEWKDSWELGDDIPASIRVNISYYPSFLVTVPMSREKKENGKDTMKERT